METSVNNALTKIGKRGKPVAYDYDKYRAYYLKNKERIIAKQSDHQSKNRERYRRYKNKWRKNNTEVYKIYADNIGFFMKKAYAINGRENDDSVEPRKLSKGLMSLWLKQRGRCALSGRKLDRSAHVDHKLPVSRGGSNSISNLQFLAPEVNMAKNSLTDSEFIQLCQEVVKHAKSDENRG